MPAGTQKLSVQRIFARLKFTFCVFTCLYFQQKYRKEVNVRLLLTCFILKHYWPCPVLPAQLIHSQYPKLMLPHQAGEFSDCEPKLWQLLFFASGLHWAALLFLQPQFQTSARQTHVSKRLSVTVLSLKMSAVPKMLVTPSPFSRDERRKLYPTWIHLTNHLHSWNSGISSNDSQIIAWRHKINTILESYEEALLSSAYSQVQDSFLS